MTKRGVLRKLSFGQKQLDCFSTKNQKWIEYDVNSSKMDRICKFWYFEKKMKVKIREYFIFPFVCKAFKTQEQRNALVQD